MNNLKHILLISYTYPPYPGIGGRRWAKFSKYLSRLGYVIHVIHSKSPFKEQSLWLDDVEKNENIKRYELNRKYPKVLSTQPKSIFNKLIYKISLILVKLFSKGTPYDKGIFWRESMLKLSNDLIIKHNIKNIIVSCAPFSSAYFAADLKQKFIGLNLIVDFRDPWTWGTSYGFPDLNKKRFDFEKKSEYTVIEKFDSVLVPSDEMKNYLIKSYPKFSNKFLLIPHCFDEDDIVVKQKNPSNSVRLLFYGTLYDNLDKVFDDLAKVIGAINKRVLLDIYSASATYKNSFESKNLLNTSVNYFGQILPKDLFNKLNLYDYVLIIQPDYAKDFITTKIYEIIYSRTPIFLVANEGKLFDFIKKNSLGLCCTPAELLENFSQILFSDKNVYKIEQFPIENYSFKSVSSNLTNCLQ